MPLHIDRNSEKNPNFVVTYVTVWTGSQHCGYSYWHLPWSLNFPAISRVYLRDSSSSSDFPAISLGFTILLLLLHSQLYLWRSPFFFCIPSYISGLHYSSSSSVFTAISLGFTILLLLLLLCSQLYLWASLFFFFFYIPSYISGLHYSFSSSVFPAISLSFTILLLCSQLYLWASLFFFFFCVPSDICVCHRFFIFNPTI